MKTKCCPLIIVSILILFISGATIHAKSESIDKYGPKVIIIDKVQPSDVLGDLYEPVEYGHEHHAQLIDNCAVCHHFFEEHYNNLVVPADRCSTCHHSPDFDKMSRNMPCDTCHNADSTPEIRKVRAKTGEMLIIPGLKGAYHRSCIECHEEMNGPTNCTACHNKR